MSKVTSIWRGRQFLPLWCSQFLSALNDNLFRYGMNAALVFGVIAVPKKEGDMIVSLSAALFILPYLAISGISGQLADKYSKSLLLRWNRGLEIFTFGLAGYALMTAQVPLLLICLVLIGALAAFYGPVKHAITPELLPDEKLIEANGAIESGTYAAILFGTLIGTSVMAVKWQGPVLAVVLIMGVAAAAWVFSLLTPNTAPAAPNLTIDWNVPRQSWDLIRWGAEDRLRTILLMGNGWFWFVGTAVLSQVTIFVKDDLHCDAQVNTLLLALFALGIGLGAWFCSFLLRGRISLQYASLAALGMAFWGMLMAGLAYAHPGGGSAAQTVHQFIAQSWTWLLLTSVVMLAAHAGLFVVPMVTMMQTCVGDDQRARMLSLSNIWFAIFIVAGSFMSAAILKVGGSPKTVFAVVSVLSLGVAVILYRLMPRDTLKGFFTGLLRTIYRVEITGLEYLADAGPSAVIVANHQSYLDGLLLGAFLPGEPIFAIDPIAASRWWAKPVVSLVDISTLNPLQPMSVRHIIQTVKSGRQCVIFPEGRLTETGGLMKVYPGPAVIAGKSTAPVVPIRIDGVQYSPFSLLRGIVPIRWFPKITITILPSQAAPDTSHLAGRVRREAMTRNLYDLMTNMVFSTRTKSDSLWRALLGARTIYGGSASILEDAARNPVSYDGLITRVYALSSALTPLTREKENVGVLLPTGIAGVVTFFALSSHGRVPAMLNFTAGPAAAAASLEAAQVKTIVTAREFIQKGKLDKLMATLSRKAEIIYLEDLRSKIGPLAKLSASLKAKAGIEPSESKRISTGDTAVILFTSGSEGLPKGVALSHENLTSNVEQVRTIVAYNSQDVVFNALPIFHAFGLTGGVLVPLLHGVKTFLHATPLQYRVIPELAYHGNATLLFGTDTFLNGFAKSANCYDFHTLRMIFAGAEKVKAETNKLYSDKFGVPIFEGYGVTECSPVIALNTPMHHKLGSVGRLLPEMSIKLTPVPGIVDGSQLWVKGPNVMKGCYRADLPGELQPPADGWYDTGDIVRVDDAGYLTILGRAKRFAKIGGEMISLASVENYAQLCWPDSTHAVISLPDQRKGETLVLTTTSDRATQSDLAKFMRASGATELSIPKTVRRVQSIPLLGSGKTDYVALKDTIQQESQSQQQIVAGEAGETAKV